MKRNLHATIAALHLAHVGCAEAGCGTAVRGDLDGNRTRVLEPINLPRIDSRKHREGDLARLNDGLAQALQECSVTGFLGGGP